MITFLRIRGAFPRGFLRATALACLFSAGLSVEASAQSLREELRELIRAHPRIEASRAQLREADAIVRQARAGFLPNVSATGSLGAEMVSNPSTRLTNDDNEIVRSNAVGVEVRQPLYDGGFAWNDTDAALLRRESGARALDASVQEIMLQGATAYIEILRISELIRVARARERTIRKQENLETERVERGAGIEVDVLQAKSRLQLAIEARVDLEGQLRTAVARYISVFQREPDITRMRLGTVPADMIPGGLDEALFIASTENPSLEGLDLLARAARVNVDVQRAAFFPSIDVVGRWDHESNVSGTRNNTKDMAVLLEMSWDIFTGFRNEATVQASQEFLIQALTASDQGIRDVNERVRQAWTKLENTRMRKELLINAVSIAQEVFAARQQLRDIGKATSLEVLDAENEVFQAEQNLIRADYDNRVAAFELAFAMGRLSPAMLNLDIEVIEDIEQYLIDPDEVEERPTLEIEESLPSPQGDGDPVIAPEPRDDVGQTETEASDNAATENASDADGTGVIESPPDETVPLQEQLQEGSLDPDQAPNSSDAADIAVLEAPQDSILPETIDAHATPSIAVVSDGTLEATPIGESGFAVEVERALAGTRAAGLGTTPDGSNHERVSEEAAPAVAVASERDGEIVSKQGANEGSSGFSFLTELFAAGGDATSSGARPEEAAGEAPGEAIDTPRASALPAVQASSAEVKPAPREVVQTPSLKADTGATPSAPVQSAKAPAISTRVAPAADPGIAVSGGVEDDGFDVPGSLLFGGVEAPPR